jgi:hypothetical protein
MTRRNSIMHPDELSLDFKAFRDKVEDQYQKTIVRLASIETRLDVLIDQGSKPTISAKQWGLLISAITALATAISVTIGKAL